MTQLCQRFIEDPAWAPLFAVFGEESYCNHPLFTRGLLNRMAAEDVLPWGTARTINQFFDLCKVCLQWFLQ